jgi:two-component system, OmpR family, sensor kinase
VAGRWVGWVVTTDMTAQRSGLPPAILETRILELEEALRARDRFLSIAAHELRNPMAPLVLQIGLMLKSARRGEMGRVVDGLELLEVIIGRYVKRANVLLDFTRLAADRIELEPAHLDVADCVRVITAGYVAMAGQGGSELRVITPDTLTACVDPMAIEQILENLISNAIKFGSGKPIDIALQREGDTMRITVRDHGPGISPEDQTRIFAPFEKVMARADGGGFGVGLWVVGRLVSEMGGRIELDSSLGNGASFAMILPLNH